MQSSAREPETETKTSPQPLAIIRSVARVLIVIGLLLSTLSAAYAMCTEEAQWLALPILPPHKPAEGEVSLVLSGDTMLARGVAKRVESEGAGDFGFPFALARIYIEEADIAFTNLETPVSDRGDKIDKKYVFRADPAAVEGLREAGFDAVSLANNHILDFGEEAAEDTARLLEEIGIRAGGLVRDQDPQEPVIFQIRGTRVGFLFYCDPRERYSCAKEFEDFALRPAEATREVIERDLADLDPKADVIIVSLHWGIEHRPEPHRHMEQLGRLIIDLGADVVAGHHPHIQHRAERYKNGVILYSMGNFVFDQWTRHGSRVARLYRILVGRDGVEQVLFLPLEIPLKRWQPVPLARGYLGLEHDSEKLRLELPECFG